MASGDRRENDAVRTARSGPDRASSARTAWRAQLRAEPMDGERRATLLDPVAAQAADGDLDALEDLIWAVDELGLLRPAIRRLLIDDRDAEEAEQDVLVAVAEAITTFRSEARFTTWLHQIARHKAIGQLRRRREVDPLPEDLGDAARISSMIATRADLDDAIGGLPELYRRAVVLRDVQQCSYDDVAAALAINVNTAKTRVARGRALAAARLRGMR